MAISTTWCTTLHISSGAIVIRLKYSKRRPDRPGGYYYYVRRIPKAYVSYFKGKYFDNGWIQKSLGTTDEAEAMRRHLKFHAEIEKQLDLYRKTDGAQVATKSSYGTAITTLLHLGLKPSDASTTKNNPDRHPEEAKHNLLQFYDYLGTKYGQPFHEAYTKPERNYFIRKILDNSDKEAFDLLTGDNDKPKLYLSDARNIYLKNHPKGDSEKFKAAINLAYEKAYQVIGDIPLEAIDRFKAQSIRDALLNNGKKTGSVKRWIGALRTMINAAIEEHALDYKNPFDKLPIPKLGLDIEEREDFANDELLTLAKACKELNDTPRHIVAALIDTGARLSEIVGLRREDVFLDGQVPYIILQETEDTDRTLKTKYSTRSVPLVGMSLWAIKEASRQTNDDWLFPRYASATKVNGNSASAAINKWLNPMFPGNKPAHSLRHTMETRLRAKDTPENIMLTIGGWSTKTTARKYGNPHPIEVTVKYLKKVAINI